MTATDNNSATVESGSNGEEKKLPYPKSVFFIVSNEFCERFSYYGMRTILILYLTDILLYSEPDAKIIYHSFTMFVYFFPVIGAILSDSFLGKFRTILYVSMIYAAGSVLLALASTDPLGIPQKPFSIVGLLLIAVGTGGIKPCVSAFGGDQFVLPQQLLQLEMFFSLFYFSINAGSLISTFLTPILRNDVHCFGNDNCFPLAFAVPGVLMIVSIIIFALGKPLYKIKEPKGNIMVDVVKCITFAIKKKIQSKKSDKAVEHWLDHSEEKFGPKLVSDIKALLKVLVLCIPLPVFWALYDQQGSGWTFQAVRMNGDLGFYTILPDQMQVVNPLLILAFIPMFTYWIYPALSKCGLLKTPLQKMVCGGFLAALAFAVSAVVSIFLESTYPIVPSSGNIQLRFYNPSQCDYTVTVKTLNISADVPSMEYLEKIDVGFKGNQSVEIEWVPKSANAGCQLSSGTFDLQEAKAYGFYAHQSTTGVQFYADSVEKTEDGFPRIRTISYKGLELIYAAGDESFKVPAGNYSLFSAPSPATYSISSPNGKIGEVEAKLGGIYTVMIGEDTKQFKAITTTKPNSVHILWLLPQYFIITAAEILFSITGLEFCYSQAPSTMKSVMQGVWLLTTAFGNLIIVLIESAKIFEKQSNDFFLYTALMVGDMFIFMWLAARYKYVEAEHSSVDDTEDEPTESLPANGIENPSFKTEST